MIQNTNLFSAKKEKTFGPILLKTLQVFNKIGPFHHQYSHTGKCILQFAGIYAYCHYFIDWMWQRLVLILYRKHAVCQRDYRIRAF